MARWPTRWKGHAWALVTSMTTRQGQVQNGSVVWRVTPPGTEWLRRTPVGVAPCQPAGGDHVRVQVTVNCKGCTGYRESLSNPNGFFSCESSFPMFLIFVALAAFLCHFRLLLLWISCHLDVSSSLSVWGFGQDVFSSSSLSQSSFFPSLRSLLGLWGVCGRAGGFFLPPRSFASFLRGFWWCAGCLLPLVLELRGSCLALVVACVARGGFLPLRFLLFFLVFLSASIAVVVVGFAFPLLLVGGFCSGSRGVTGSFP